MKLINIGFGNMINADRVVAVVSPDSAPVKRIIQQGKEKGNLIDCTHGRRTKCVILTDCDQIILTHLTDEALALKFNKDGEGV